MTALDTMGRALGLKHRAEARGFKVTGWVFGQFEALDLAGEFNRDALHPTLSKAVEHLEAMIAGRVQIHGLPVRVVGELNLIRVEVE